MEDQAAQIQKYMRKRLREFTDSTNDAAVRRDLAVLRRGVGKAPGEYPELFGILFDINEFPESLMSRYKDPSPAEWAVSSALCLFALHQQGMDLHEQPMNKEDIPFGKAARMLASDEDGLERVRRRFNQVLEAPDIRSCTYYLRTLIQMLRAEKIPMNYPQLAQDLYWFQISEGQGLRGQTSPQDRVRLRWGQDFYRTKDNTKDKEEGGEEE